MSSVPDIDREHVYPQTEAEGQRALENAKSGQTIHMPRGVYLYPMCNVDDLHIVGNGARPVAGE